MDENERQKHKQWAKDLLNKPSLINKSFDETFKKYDKNQDGTIDTEEFYSFLDDVYKTCGFESGISQNYAEQLFKVGDLDKNGKIEKQEFKREFKKALVQIITNN